MPTDPDLRLLAELCSQPTAPFAEHAVINFVRQWASRQRLDVRSDSAGNLLVALPGRSSSAQTRRLVFAAHLDHPGFVADRQDGRTLLAHFRGGVRASHMTRAAVCFFPAGPDQPLRGVVEATAGEPYPASAVIRLTGSARPVPPGTPGLFDLTPARFTRTHFHSRACDDLAGAAAALAALRHLRRRRGPTPVAVLLTRAEEVGFIGALEAVRAAPGDRLLNKRHDLLLAIECSAEQPYARQHDGVVIRVGDRTSVFNSSLTAFLTDTARKLAEREATFKFQRALMPGGTCESTVYDAWGYHAAAVCVPLGNYHNMPPLADSTRAQRSARTGSRPHLAAEHISLADYRNMIRLFVEVGLTAHTYRPGHVELKKRLLERLKKLRPLLTAPAASS